MTNANTNSARHSLIHLIILYLVNTLKLVREKQVLNAPPPGVSTALSKDSGEELIKSRNCLIEFKRCRFWAIASWGWPNPFNSGLVSNFINVRYVAKGVSSYQLVVVEKLMYTLSYDIYLLKSWIASLKLTMSIKFKMMKLTRILINMYSKW